MVVVGYNDAPLGGDRVLQCGSLRTSEAPLSSSFTHDDSIPPSYLCVPASQNAAAAALLHLRRISAKRCPDRQTGKTTERLGLMKQA